VRVFVVLDAFGGQALQGAWADSLRAAGVEVAFLRRERLAAINRVANRSHVRAIVIDGVVGYTGGFGLADYWLGDGHTPGEWRETNVRVRGPAVAQLQAAFGVAWANATGQILAGDVLFPEAALAPSGSAAAAVIFMQPTKGTTPAGRYLALSIASARRTLYISNAYFIPDADFRRLLAAAVARGVDVRVLTPGDRSDIKAVYFASRDRFPELLRSGVRLYEYQPAMMHAKTLVVDGVWSAVGSMNFDNRSLALNDEALLVALDARVGASMDSLFRDDLRFAREITLERFDERPWWHPAAELGARLIARVL
jgi:cardiolipin synthase